MIDVFLLRARNNVYGSHTTTATTTISMNPINWHVINVLYNCSYFVCLHNMDEFEMRVQIVFIIAIADAATTTIARILE